MTCHHLFALECIGQVSQRYEINNQIHDQQDLSNVLLNVSFDKKYKTINFDLKNKLRINNEMNYPCEPQSSKTVCLKKATFLSEMGERDPNTGTRYESTAHTEYFMEIIYDNESRDLIFDHQIKSTVSKPKKIQSSEIASGKFKCK
ncbi:hypothetical protein VI34_03410 [Methylophilales bacterium MBRSG12]|uniref:Uncharacterized protein n=1 Tax=Methylophilales bacterium MBRS-H7 TaxID=1623450 RepID=A0A0H4IXU2_9PROT|nr:hypothetical protein UZ34_06915 [Methylophilales bacterium MBRSF5]AKO65781.1 hypothetical protein VI33_03415 [Methylophilales bacterium MBRS-H7]AKO67100.1 hypothetical protein VI34_03410 [Methylophilales bacterium MBRSG12]